MLSEVVDSRGILHLWLERKWCSVTIQKCFFVAEYLFLFVWMVGLLLESYEWEQRSAGAAQLAGGGDE